MNSNSISSKRGFHSIEGSITTETKLANIMRRLEAIETKEPVSINQVRPTPSVGCTYYQAMNHVFEECPFFLTHQTLPEHMNAAFSKPANNLYSSTYNPGLRNHANFLWGPNNNDQIRPKFSNNFQQSPYQQNFPNQSPPPSFQNSHMERRLSCWPKGLPP